MASPTELPGLPAGAADPCVHCGFCLPTCASYRVLASEMDSPRGRIHALRAIEAGELELDATVASHFDTCLGCYACVSACPSGVRYDQLIEATRPKLNQLRHRSSWQISFRQLLLQVLPYPRRLRRPGHALRACMRAPLSDCVLAAGPTEAGCYFGTALASKISAASTGGGVPLPLYVSSSECGTLWRIG